MAMHYFSHKDGRKAQAEDHQAAEFAAGFAEVSAKAFAKATKGADEDQAGDTEAAK